MRAGVRVGAALLLTSLPGLGLLAAPSTHSPPSSRPWQASGRPQDTHPLQPQLASLDWFQKAPWSADLAAVLARAKASEHLILALFTQTDPY